MKTFDEWYCEQLEKVNAISPATKKIAQVLWDNVFASEIEKLQKQNDIMRKALELYASVSTIMENEKQLLIRDDLTYTFSTVQAPARHVLKQIEDDNVL
jgi:hypothetical protein